MRWANGHYRPADKGKRPAHKAHSAPCSQF
jgi:hypothetical protein